MDIEQPPSLIGLATQSDGGFAYNPKYNDPYEKDKAEYENKIKDKTTGALIRIIIIATALFIVFSQRVLYKITNKASQYMMSTPIHIIDEMGSPTTKGVFVHALLFFIIMLFVVF